MADDDNLCPLHKCIFDGDIRQLSQLLRTNDPSAKDKHGKWKISCKIKRCANEIIEQISPVSDCCDSLTFIISLTSHFPFDLKKKTWNLFIKICFLIFYRKYTFASVGYAG